MTKTEWNRSLGTSKRKQGISTPKRGTPRTRKNGVQFRVLKKVIGPMYAKLISDKTKAIKEARKKKALKLAKK